MLVDVAFHDPTLRGANEIQDFITFFGGWKVDFNFFQGPAIVEAIQE
jgi:hypothetical protein